jgi:hypothetical protein
MNPLKNVILTLVLPFVFLCFSCNKEHPPKAVLPSITQEGKNTVGFTIDGAVWLPYNKCSFFSNSCGEIFAGVGQPAVIAQGMEFMFSRRIESKSSSLHISTMNTTVTSTGEKIDSVYCNYRGENANGNTGSYTGAMPGSHFIVTKFDTAKQIISGTFELILAEDNRSGRTITLKDGRFDFRFNHCQCSNR